MVDGTYDGAAVGIAAVQDTESPSTLAPAAFPPAASLEDDLVSPYGVIKVAPGSGGRSSGKVAAAPTPAPVSVSAPAPLPVSDSAIQTNGVGNDDGDIYSSMDHTSYRAADAAAIDDGYGPSKPTPPPNKPTPHGYENLRVGSNESNRLDATAGGAAVAGAGAAEGSMHRASDDVYGPCIPSTDDLPKAAAAALAVATKVSEMSLGGGGNASDDDIYGPAILATPPRLPPRPPKSPSVSSSSSNLASATSVSTTPSSSSKRKARPPRPPKPDALDTLELTNDIYSSASAIPEVPALNAAPTQPRPPKTAMVSALNQNGYASEVSDGMYEAYSVDEDDEEGGNGSTYEAYSVDEDGDEDEDEDGGTKDVPGAPASTRLPMSPAVVTLRRDGSGGGCKSERAMRGRSGALTTKPVLRPGSVRPLGADVTESYSAVNADGPGTAAAAATAAADDDDDTAADNANGNTVADGDVYPDELAASDESSDENGGYAEIDPIAITATITTSTRTLSAFSLSVLSVLSGTPRDTAFATISYGGLCDLNRARCFQRCRRRCPWQGLRRPTGPWLTFGVLLLALARLDPRAISVIVQRLFSRQFAHGCSSRRRRSSIASSNCRCRSIDHILGIRASFRNRVESSHI